MVLHRKTFDRGGAAGAKRRRLDFGLKAARKAKLDCIILSPTTVDKRLLRMGHVMKPKELTDDGSILDFMVSDEALERAATDTIFSLGNCTDARTCRVPNYRNSRSGKR